MHYKNGIRYSNNVWNGVPIAAGVWERRGCKVSLFMLTLALASNAVVTSEIKLKQNKRKTMFCFSEIVLFQFYFSFISDVTTV